MEHQICFVSAKNAKQIYKTTWQITRRPQRRTGIQWICEKGTVTKGIKIPSAWIKSSAIQQQSNQTIQFWISSRKLRCNRSGDRLLSGKKNPAFPRQNRPFRQSKNKSTQLPPEFTLLCEREGERLKRTSIEPQRERLGGGVLLRLGEVVEEAPAGLDVDVDVPGELPERDRRLPRQPRDQILGRERPRAAAAKNPAHGGHRQRHGSPRSRHCRPPLVQEPTEQGGRERRRLPSGVEDEDEAWERKEETVAASGGPLYRGRLAFHAKRLRD